jgi:predicted phosphodiesterase
MRGDTDPGTWLQATGVVEVVDMRYAIISDIHSNAAALEAVLSDIEKMRVGRTVCLGDSVGYGAEPGMCIAKVRELGSEVVLGNHDSAAVGDTPIEYFNLYAKEAVLWTAGRLADDEKDYINSLPLRVDVGDFTIVHSSLAEPKQWGYVMDLLSARDCFRFLRKKLCFIGHSHLPVIFQEKEKITYSMDGEVGIEDGARYIINVGSVGQPRDGDPRASYGIYDAEEKRVEIRRVQYDVKVTQENILAAGLPAFLAFRLGIGR